MLRLIARYAEWLHTRWPAGTVERLPESRADGATNVPGASISGDLTGIPLLKFALDSGARVARAATPSDPAPPGAGQVLDLAIVGAGVSGMAAAVEARNLGLKFEILEATEPFTTLVNFPKGKPIFTYPRSMTPAGALQVKADVKEELISELRAQTDQAGIRPTAARVERVERTGDLLDVRLEGGATLKARRVLIAIGKSGDFRMLGVPGEHLDKVYNRLYDPKDYAGQEALVVGGGDSALETAIALAQAGAHVTLSYRRKEFSRPKHENVVRVDRLVTEGSLKLRLGTRVKEIRPTEAVLADGSEETIRNDVVFTMLGREAPLEFFRRSGIRIAGEMRRAQWAALSLFVLFCVWLYNWKSGGSMSQLFADRHWFPFNLPDLLSRAPGAIASDARTPSTLLGTIAISASGPSFWYTLAYSTVVVVFGLKRIRRRKTPYVTAQTLTLMLVQVLPLFLLPEIILPQLAYHGLLPRGLLDALFPVVTYGHGREFWRAYGLILAWPLDVYNIFTHDPLWWWIGIGALQTLVLIPLGIYFFGKGVYCGWICSCGALAETLGDTQRHKMPHGPFWNRLNMAGQGVLLIAVLLLILRILGWILPDGNWIDSIFDPFLKTPYKWGVDVFLAGVLGYGLYFWFSGRVWCRFFCPLAALMHIYARFSRFAIVADKKKCISCNVCTSVCHQGIDVMNFANKGAPMQDPECVRCSACVQSCPTGVLQFGQVDRKGKTLKLDLLPASPVIMREGPV
ncbi:MAG TPA: NAD(P)-binding domain-containing protein [Candidatus Binatia bacterium]|nr:NAD(P)-binding domain-containing protein [Candidatus Binatia bacterium]